MKEAEPVKKRLIGFSHSVKQVMTEVHSLELYLSPEIYDLVAEQPNGMTFFKSSTTGFHVFAGPYGDQADMVSKKM